MRNLFLVLAVVVLCTVGAQNALAKSDLGLNALGVNLGMVDPEGVDAVLGFGAFADWGTIAPQFGLTTHLDYWSKSEDIGFGAEASVTDISFITRSRYLFAVDSPKFQPFVGAGLGLHFVSAEVSIPDMDLGGGVIVPGMTVEDSSTELGFDLGAGFSTPISPKADLSGELWYSLVDQFDQVALKLGVAFKLGS